MKPIDVLKNALETVRFQITEFKGTTHADIRLCYQVEDDEWRPTDKSLTVTCAGKSLSIASFPLRALLVTHIETQIAI